VQFSAKFKGISRPGLEERSSLNIDEADLAKFEGKVWRPLLERSRKPLDELGLKSFYRYFILFE